jgi:predicted permease
MRLFDDVRKDVRHAVRIFLQNPGFAAVAILSLALGIGANTAIFTLIDTVLLRSLPVPEPERLVVVARNPDNPETGFNYPDYEYIRDHNKSFSGVAAYSAGWQAAMEAPEPGAHSAAQLVNATFASGNYFETLGVTPAVGRLLTRTDNQTEDAHPSAALDYGFWQRRFGGDPRVVGRAITLNGSPFTIVGVVRPGFTGTVVGSHPDVYVPIMMLREIDRGVRQWNTRHFWWLNVMARLKPGATLESAKPEVDLLWKQILANDPERRPAAAYDTEYKQRNRGALLPGSGGYSFFRNNLQKPLAVLMIVVALVLLIACANVANLLLARAAARQREIAIRLAVGAGRARLVRQLIVESLMLSVLGGLAAIAIAWWGVRVLLTFMPKRGIPIDLDLSPDWRLLAFAFAISVAAGLLCGIAPALQATRPDLISALKNETAAIGRIRFDLRRALVVAQVAISLLLLIGAGLFVRSLENLRSLDTGFVRENVMLIRVNPEQSGYKGQRLRDFYERLLARVERFDNVRAASLAMITPLAGMQWNMDVAVEGYQRKPDEKPYIDFNSVSPGYFGTLGIPILLGRDFRVADNPAFTPNPPVKEGPEDNKLGPPAPVAIINETMAKKFFPHENPIGRRFTQGDKFDSAKSFEIVGVVKDTKYFDLREAVQSMIYVPAWRFGARSNTLCIRSTRRPEQLAGAIRREVANIDPAIPVLQTLTLEEQFDNTIGKERVVTTLCGFFGLLALLLAAMGLYGVMAHSVTRRYREIGIRMALGSNRSSVLWLVLRETALMIGLGACIGLPAALALMRLASSFLYGLTPQDPLSIVLAVAVLTAVTALAGYIPARRATTVDPMIALRYE